MQFKRRETTTLIVLHESRTTPGEGYQELLAAKREHGYLDVGAHFVVERDGGVIETRDVHAQGTHASGFNSISVGIILLGGRGESGCVEDNFTPAQKLALHRLVDKLLALFPEATVVTHASLPAYGRVSGSRRGKAAYSLQDFNADREVRKTTGTLP